MELTWPGNIPLLEVLTVAEGHGASSYSITHPPAASSAASPVTTAALYWGNAKDGKKISTVEKDFTIGEVEPSKWRPIEGTKMKKNSVLKALRLIANEHALPWSSRAAAVEAAAAEVWPKALHLLQSDDLKSEGEALMDKLRNASSPIEAVLAGGCKPTASMLVKTWAGLEQRKQTAVPEVAVGYGVDSFKKPEEMDSVFANYVTDKQYKTHSLEFRGEPDIGKSAFILRMLAEWGFKNPFMASSSFLTDFYSHGGVEARFKPGVHDAIVHDDCTLPDHWNFEEVKKYLEVKVESGPPFRKIGNTNWFPVNIPAGVPKIFLLNYEDGPVVPGLMDDGSKIIANHAVAPKRLLRVMLPKTFTEDNPLYHKARGSGGGGGAQ